MDGGAVRVLELDQAPFRRTARRHSICEADAEDAYQRACLIACRKAPDAPRGELAAWMHTVVKREAWRVKRERLRLFPQAGQGEDALAREQDRSLSVAELAESRAEGARTGAALRSLKGDQRRALGMLALGFSYREICRATGWTYTNVSRLIGHTSSEYEVSHCHPSLARVAPAAQDYGSKPLSERQPLIGPALRRVSA